MVIYKHINGELSTETFSLMWLLISSKITKLRSSPVSPSYPKQVPQTGVIFYWVPLRRFERRTSFEFNVAQFKWFRSNHKYAEYYSWSSRLPRVARSQSDRLVCIKWQSNLCLIFVRRYVLDELTFDFRGSVWLGCAAFSLEVRRARSFCPLVAEACRVVFGLPRRRLCNSGDVHKIAEKGFGRAAREKPMQVPLPHNTWNSYRS